MNEKMIAKLESKGFRRWTKGNMDRLYINAQAMGLTVSYHKTGSVAEAYWNGERVSNAEGRRMMDAKTYIDLKDDTLHSDNYWCDTLKDAAQALIDEATAEIEAEEKAEAEQAQAVEETEAEAPEIEKEKTMEHKKWYAVMLNKDDEDWGFGSSSPDEAQKMVVERIKDYPDAYIAVIENDVCIEERKPEDFDPVWYNAYRILTASDWYECKDECAALARWLDMEDEWEAADEFTFPDVIKKMGDKIGVDLLA